MSLSSRSRELMMEVVVGAFMFATLIGLCVFTIILSRENVFKPSYSFEVVFDDIMGLRDGDNVVIRGLTVGKVKNMRLASDGVHVHSALNQPLVLRTDYKIEIIPTSVLGGRYMQIDAGRAAAELPPDEMPHGAQPHDLIALASSVVADFKDISSKISKGEGTLGKLVNDEGLYNDAREVVGELKAAIKERDLLKNIESSVANLNDISDKINQGDGTIGKLVNDDQLYEALRAGVANINQISDKINKGEGTLGKLVNDETLYTETKKTVAEARYLIDDLRETSPIVTFSSIFFGAF